MTHREHRLIRSVPGHGIAAGILLLVLFPPLGSHAQNRDRFAAIQTGMAWLAERQIQDGPHRGSWDVPRAEYRPAVASLAGLAFLANGYLPHDEPYGKLVEQAMRHVMSTMRPDGYLGMDDRSGMYIHAISTLFGLSFLGTSDDPALERDLAEWCRRSIALIEEAQKVRKNTIDVGGWRYTPYTTESDVSVTCWQLLVLHAARQCGYAVDPSVVHAGLTYINRAFVQPRSDAPKALLTNNIYMMKSIAEWPRKNAKNAK